MQWDLVEEHQGAYSEEVCKKIDELTDLFNIILDEIRLYPLMMCVDVFPCINSLSIEIPRHIQDYYRIYLDEEYKDKMQKRFDFELDLLKRETYSVYNVLKNIFDSEYLLKMCTSRPINQDENIKKVADRLSEIVGTTYTECFGISKKDLNILQELYIGILFSGWILQCGSYGILILLGTNE